MNNIDRDNLLEIGAAALRKAALSEEAKAFVLENPLLFQTLKKAADRYLGGESLAETIVKVQHHNAMGLKCSIEFMGESSRTAQLANEATSEFISICNAIKRDHLNATVSLDLSHIGLAISSELCLQNLNEICTKAAAGKIEVIISAEDCQRTDDVLNAYKEISRIHQNVGITLQAYLFRTERDLVEMMKLPGRIRIVKGAFETPPGLSLPRGEKLDNVYLKYVERLISEKHLCSIATHDNAIQTRAKELIAAHNADFDTLEFESLFGIQNEQLMALHNEGYPAKLYFVYGSEWYLYLCNRLAEYPLNVFRALNDIVQ
jgi:proline dehydrogenase